MDLTKKDWLDLKASAEAQIKLNTISLVQFETLLELANKKIAEFPDEAKIAEKELEELTKQPIGVN